MFKNTRYIALLLIFITFGFSQQKSILKLYKIPPHKLNLYELLGDSTTNKLDTIYPLQISELVTFKEYKKYLHEIKADSSESFYLKQLPDTSIAHTDMWKEYISSKKYEPYPVLGISWDAAMNYCKWKTLKEVKNDSLNTVYQLPYMSEWLAANNYLTANKVRHDFNQNYSDWLVVCYDESIYNFNSEHNRFVYDYSYSHRETDPPVLKRKRHIGNSYLFNGLNYLTYGYAYQGYRHVGFRYVKRSFDYKPTQDVIDAYFDTQKYMKKLRKKRKKAR